LGQHVLESTDLRVGNAPPKRRDAIVAPAGVIGGTLRPSRGLLDQAVVQHSLKVPVEGGWQERHDTSRAGVDLPEERVAVPVAAPECNEGVEDGCL
jgi:hypothetical protein